MKKAILAFVLSAFALSFFVAQPAVALSDRVSTPVVGQNVAQFISA